MTNLKKYVVGIKPKDKEEMILANDALEKTKEHMMVLLIPKSKLDKIIQEVSNESKAD